MSLSDIGATEKDAQYILGTFLHSWILQIFAYGIYTVVYCVALCLTLRGRRLPAAILITIMWILVTINTGSIWASVDYSFIRNVDSKETQLLSITDIGSYTMRTQVLVVVAAFFGFVLADLTMIWRCWVIYGRGWRIVVIPIISLIAAVVAHIFRSVTRLTSIELAVTYREINWELILLSCTVFTTTYCTITIIVRVVAVTGFARALKTYRGVLEIFIESAVMYTVNCIVWIGILVHAGYFTQEWDLRYLYPTALGNIIVGLAPTLIIARVAAGHARPDTSWTRVTALKFPTIKTTVQTFVDNPHLTHHDRGAEIELGLKSEDNEESSGYESKPTWEGNQVEKTEV